MKIKVLSQRVTTQKRVLNNVGEMGLFKPRHREHEWGGACRPKLIVKITNEKIF